MIKCYRCRSWHNGTVRMCTECSIECKENYKNKMAAMTPEEKAKEVYKRQVYRAKERNIEFNFSYEEWVKWWENNLGPDWLQKRGIRSGQYCMARFKDKGPYSIENVECITNNENH